VVGRAPDQWVGGRGGGGVKEEMPRGVRGERGSRGVGEEGGGGECSSGGRGGTAVALA